MPRILIDDLDDPRIAFYRNLKASNLTRDRAQFVVEGAKLVDRLRESRYPLASVLTSDRLEPSVAGHLPDDIPWFVVPHASIDLLVGFNFHQGVLACGFRRPPPPLAELARSAGPGLSLVVCPTLSNPENLGAIVRIADVFGVDAVLVGERCPDPLSRRVLRVSMGTVLRLPVIASSNLALDVEELQRDWGVETIATVVDPSAEPLGAAPLALRHALFLGSESAGLEPQWIARCDRRLTIPMRPGAESLNVSVAAGIILYEATRSRLRPD